LFFAKLSFGDHPAVLGVALGISFGLASLSYRFIEVPFQHGMYFLSSLARTYILGACLILTATSTGIAMRHFAPDSVYISPGQYISASKARRDRPAIYFDRCLRRFEDVEHKDCRYGVEAATKSIVLLGDSHAGNWFEPINQAATAEGWDLLVRVKASCRPIDVKQNVTEGRQERVYTECSTWLGNVLAEIERIRPRLIIVAGTRHQFPIAAERFLLERLSSVTDTIVMRETPWYPQNAVTCLLKAQDPSRCEWPLQTLLAEDDYPRTPPLALPARIRILDLNRRICPQDLCRAVLDEKVVMFDEHHLTASFSRTLADEFRAILKSMP
jgi:hypothetical protein